MIKVVNFFKQRIWILILIAAIVFIPQSFNYQAKLNMRVLVTGMGIDKVEQGYEVTAQVIMPTPGSEAGGSGARLDFITEQGRSVSEGIQKIAYKIGKTAGLSHAGFVIVGESMLEDNLSSALDYFARDAKVNPSLMLLVCSSSAKDTLKQTGKLELSVGVDLQKVFIYKENSLNGLVMPIEEFINSNFGISKSSMASGVYIAPEGEGSKSSQSSSSQQGSGGLSSGGQGMQGGDSSNKEKNARIKFYNDIYYFKDGEYVNKFEDEKEILGVFFSDKIATNGNFKVENVTGEILEKATIGISFTNKRTKTSVRFDENKPTFIFDIKLKDVQITEILNQDKPTMNLYNRQDKQVLELIKEKIEEEIEGCITAAFYKSQNDNVDVFDIGEKIYQAKPKKWEKFYEEYGENYLKNINVEVKVSIGNIN